MGVLRSSSARLVEAGDAERRRLERDLHVDGPSTTLTRNIANNNHNLGIATVPGVTYGGGNHAGRNGHPGQCTNLAC